MLTRKFVLCVLFENDIAELSDCDCTQFAEQILSYTTDTDSGNCWNPTSSFSRIESASKTIWFFAYPTYYVQSHNFLNMHLIFTHAIFPSRKRLQINSKTEAAFPTRLTNRCASGNQKTVPKFTKSFAVSRCTSPHPLACKCMSATDSIYNNTDLGAS